MSRAFLTLGSVSLTQLFEAILEADDTRLAFDLPRQRVVEELLRKTGQVWREPQSSSESSAF